MPKITKEDLEALFNVGNQNENNLRESQVEKVKIQKTKRGQSDDLVLKKIRKKIKRIKKNKDRSVPWESILKFAAFAGFLGFILFLSINFRSYLVQLDWIYRVDYLGESIEKSKTPSPTPSRTRTPDNTLALPNLPSQNNSNENSIQIEKIGVNAPVIWDVEEERILDFLKDGVVHYKGTSHPGEGGNIFLVGHSSNYFWIKSDYNEIFALLDKLSSGDRIEIKRNGQSYFYDVFQSKVVSPQDVSVLDSSQKEILTIMTCWPVGTSLNRLIVQAEYAYSMN